jgi:diaminopimelate epimerase
VHVVVLGKMPEDYETVHRRIVNELGLENRDAVGVVWVRYLNHASRVRIDPVVWVRAIDSFFYETSCGSGSIAVGKVTKETKLEQVTGQKILVKFEGENLTLSSEMEVISNVILRPSTTSLQRRHQTFE